MQESTLTGLPGTTLLSIAAFALIATAIFAFAASFAFRQVHNASLEPPDHQLKPPPELLAKAQPLTDTDLLPLLSMTTHVPRNDRSSFHQHLWNKAVANGWYTYRHRASTYIIMPSDHAPALEDLAADPVPWATGNPPPITKSQAPLVKTKLSFSPERYYPTHLWEIAGIFAAVFSCISFLSAAISLIVLITRRPLRPLGNPGQP